MCEPDMSVVAFESDKFNIIKVIDEMTPKVRYLLFLFNFICENCCLWPTSY
jgi:hypothetical protein